MGVYIVGFICALVLAVIVIGWIVYCMFVRERHKSECYQYNISDLNHQNKKISGKEDEVAATQLSAGVIFIPSRQKQKDDYEKSPDYPENPASTSPRRDNLIEILNEGCESEAHYRDGIYEVDAISPKSHYSDV